MFATTVDTLTLRDADSMLAVMFSGRHRVHKDPKKVSSSQLVFRMLSLEVS